MLPGSPHSLGASWDGAGVNFAVFSAHASMIELCLFETDGARELRRLALPECTDEVWHGYLPEAQPGTVYGYRAYGPYEPEQGQRFNPHKLLLDPYARRMVGALHWSDALYGFQRDSPRTDLSFDRRDSAPFMPKAVVVDASIGPPASSSPRTPWAETVIYEAHLRGLTLLREDIPAPLRGSFAALGHPRSIEYLVKLGVTAIELLPIQACAHERVQVEAGRCNYWGYSPLAYFVPEPRYLASRDEREMREAIAQLHAAGIEVILDVVYNHTGEGGASGPTLSFRGLDNRSYYRLLPGEARACEDLTGCGNTLNVPHPMVLRLVMDSLRYWVGHFGIDGFRFDLASTLARDDEGFDPNSGFFRALRQDPVLSQVKLIAEPWDQGPGGYQLGAYPPGFGEWNDVFRDHVRRFWRGDEGQLGLTAERLHGSGDRFDHHARRPIASINFVTAHDGFTLRDLVSYSAKRNLDNGEDNRDGADESFSGNWGVEGETDDREILETRARIQRALLATLFFSQGTPMLLAGDELNRTQMGNNNPWCQDNRVSWIDWTLLDTAAGASLHAFVRRLIALRREHCSLRGAQYLHGRDEPIPGLADIFWLDANGEGMTAAGWQYRGAKSIALRRACRGSRPFDGAQDRLAGDPRTQARQQAGSYADRVDVSLLLINGAAEPCPFALPAPKLSWTLSLDSADPEAPARAIKQESLMLGAHSIMLLVAEAAGAEPA